MERLPLTPENVTVLGSRVKATDAAWTGLDLDRAEIKHQSTLSLACFGAKDAPADLHLDVPWMHPEDRKTMAGDPDSWCYYRVRPKVTVGKKHKGKVVTMVGLEQWGGKWWIVFDTEPQK